MNINEVVNKKFWQKRLWFNNYINQKVYDTTGDYITLVISRDNVFEESYNQFHTTSNLNLKKSVQIHFIDEKAQDVGGVFREWYSSLFNELFSTKYNLFYEIQNNYGPTSMFITTENARNLENDQISYYNFFGKILGKGLYDKNIIKVNLNRVLLNHLLKKEITLEDIKYFDNQIFISLDHILKEERIEDLMMPFTWNIKNEKGELVEKELCDGGLDIMINNQNKALFVSKV